MQKQRAAAAALFRPLLLCSRLSTVVSPLAENTGKLTTVPTSARTSNEAGHSNNAFVGAVKAVNLPSAVLPAANLLDKIVPKAGQRRKFSERMRKFEQIVAEIDFLYTISTEVPAALDTAQWVQLLDTVSAAEREHLLRTIYYAGLVEEQKQRQRRTDNNNYNEDEDDAEMQTNPSTTIQQQFFGDDFCAQKALKGRMDARFGKALCQNFALEPADRMPKLLVDCRFMYAHKSAHILSAAKRVNQLHMNNWTSGTPFPISVVNFFADDTVNRIVKSQWHFLYGTQSEQAELGVNCHNFMPHPFAPEVTTRGVVDICARDAIPKDQIAYVSQRATDYLPDNLGQFRAFVLLPFDDWEQRWLLPTKAALAEKLPCYRLPLDQHICDVSRNIPCWLVANILREVYTGRMDWPTVARRWGRELTSLEYRPNSDQIDPEQLPFAPELYMEKRKLRAKTLEKLEQYSDMLLNGKANNAAAAASSTASDGKEKQRQNFGVRHAGRERLTPALVTSVKQRKYTREERNRRRLEEKKAENDD